MLDDGSFDTFAPKAPIYCSDAGGQVMVGMLVTDMGGNTNMCMVTVFVDDKVDAKMIAPDDITVPCDFAYDESALDDFFGEATILDNCPEENYIVNTLVGELNSCSAGVLTREMRLFNAQDQMVDYKEQKITFTSGTPLTLGEIIPPSPEVDIDGCGFDDIANLDQPQIPLASCRLTSIAIENDTFPFVNIAEGACLKIVRDYTIRFISEDRCGNQSVVESNISVINSKNPTAYCYEGLSTSLTLMDPDNDGTFEPMAMLDVSFFDAGSNHPCDNVDILGVSFSADLNDVMRIFDCNSLDAPQVVQVWVTDENGNTSFCEAELTVDDPDGLCGTTVVTLQGNVHTESNASLDDAAIEMSSIETVITNTDENGYFTFGEMPTGGSYEVMPIKDNDVLNGVSTLDLVMIQRHILGLENIDSPYKLVAADINNDEKLTASDLLSLRKVILGIEEKFPNNTSWRFIDEGFVFDDESNPWSSNLSEGYSIPVLESDMWIDFIGIKTGDINESASTSNVQSDNETIGNRSDNTLSIGMTNIEVEEGKEYSINVLATKSINLSGMQMAWSIFGIDIESVASGQMNIKSSDFLISEAKLKMSYANAIGDYVKKGDVLFTINIKATKNGLLSEMITLNSKSISSEAYTGSNLLINDLEIDWRSDNGYALESFEVSNVSPNPWQNNAAIIVTLPSDGNIGIKLRDVSGRIIFSKNTYSPKGKHTVNIENTEVNQPGIYFIDISFGSQVITKKMIKIE